jgi:hypothetical protein
VVVVPDLSGLNLLETMAAMAGAPLRDRLAVLIEYELGWLTPPQRAAFLGKIMHEVEA